MISFNSIIELEHIYRLITATRTKRSKIIEICLIVPLLLVLIMLLFAFKAMFQSALLLLNDSENSQADKLETLSSIPGFWINVALAIFIGLPFLVWLVFKIYKDTRKIFDDRYLSDLTYRKFKNQIQSSECSIDKAGVISFSPANGKTVYSWDQFSSYVDDYDLLFLNEKDNKNYLILPMSNVKNAQDRQTIKTLIEENLKEEPKVK